MIVPRVLDPETRKTYALVREAAYERFNLHSAKRNRAFG